MIFREKQRVPFELLKDFPIYDIGGFLEKKFAESLLPGFRDLVLQRVESITTKDLKDINKEVINEILLKTKRLISDCLKKVDTDQLDRADINLLSRLFKSPFMEKRLRSLNEIKELTERATKAAWFKESTWLTPKVLCDWILSEQLVEQIFTYSHPEMIKRISDILKFLYRNDALTIEHLELLWESAVGKHDSLEIETHKAIMDIASNLKLDMQMVLYRKMKEVNLHDYNEKFLKMVKEFTMRILEQAALAKTPLEDIGIEIFIPLIEDACVVNFCDIAVDCLTDILGHSTFKTKVYKMLQHCIDNVVQEHSVPQSLKMLKCLLPVSYSSTASEENIKKLDRYAEGLVSKILVELEGYMKKGVDDYEVLVHGRYTHKQNVKTRLKTLEFIIINNLLPFNISQFEILWKIFVLEPTCRTDLEVFFKWLNKLNKEKINKETTVEIFNNLFCTSLPISSLTAQALECFKTQFFCINQLEKRIEFRNGNFHSRISENLVGINQLYQIVMLSESPEIWQNASIFLVTLHLKLSKAALQAKNEIWGDFISRCLSYIENSMENSEIICRVLKTFQFFLEEMTSVGRPATNKLTNIYFRSPVDKDHQKFLVSGTETMRAVRKRLAEFYKKPLATIAVKMNNVQYDSSNDNVYMCNFTSNVMSIDFVVPKSGENSAREFLAKHQQLQDLLFGLLADPSKLYCSEAWTLLTSLPVNERIKQQLIDLDEEIQSIIDHSSLYKLLYCLVIVRELVKDSEWVEKFKAKQGIVYLLQLFREKDIFSLSTATCLKYSTVMVTLIEEFFKDNVEVEEQFIHKLLDCLIVIGKYSVDPDDEEVSMVARSAKNIFSDIFRVDKDSAGSHVESYGRFDELIEFTLLACKNKYYPNSIMNLFLEITTNSPSITRFLIMKLFAQLSKAISNPGSFHYWNLLSHIIRETVNKSEISSMLKDIKRLLRDYSPEVSSKEKDVVLWGILSILKVSIECGYISAKTKFIHLILHECLFETSSQVYANPPKCKSDENRQLAFSLLEVSCERRPTIIPKIISYLSKFHEDPNWRTGKYTDWNYSPVSLEKSITGYVGLKNLGTTCYMNSTLQQLFNIPTIREQILATRDPSESQGDSVLYQLQFIFSGLKDSAKQYVNPKGLCGAFKDWEGRPINVMEQMDAEEFFNNLMDKLENQMKGGPNQDSIKNHFGGIQTTECIGKNTCSHRSERDEAFLTLNVQVKNKKSLIESLESFVEGEILEGDNAYQCDFCESKVTALRRVCIKNLPNTLVIALRRFEFDFNTMNRMKVNDYCEFPLEIDMEPYTQEGLERSEVIREIKRSENTTKEIPPRKFVDDYYKFNLKGIVIHTGTAESGHYYSYIQDRLSGKWHEFNDNFVYAFDPEDIPGEAFGGVEKWQSMYTSNYTVSSREKFRNAYLLVYEREHKYKPRGRDDETLEDLVNVCEVAKTIEFREVIDENERYWRCKSTFSPEYFGFVLRLMKIGNPDITKFACAFFLVIFIRSKDFGRMPDFILQVTTHLKKHEHVREWLAEVICVKNILRELIFECPISEKRKIIVNFLASAFEGLSKPRLLKVIKSMLNKFQSAVSSRSPNSYFELLYILAKQDPDICSQCMTVSYILSHLKGEELSLEYPEDFENTDIYLGYTPDFPDTDRSDKFCIDESGRSISYMCALLGLLSSSFTPEQTKTLFEKTILNTLIFVQHKVGTRLIGQMYSFLCTNSKEKTKEYSTALLNAYREYDFDRSKIFFRQLVWLLRLEDELRQERVDFIMHNFLEIMKENKIYAKITEVSIDFLLKLAGKIPAVRDWLFLRKKDYSWIEGWLKENLYQQSRSGISLYKKNTQSFVSCTYVAKSNSDRFDMMKRLAKPQFPDSSNEWDSDDDIPEEALRPQSRVDVYDQMMQRWIKGIVFQNFGGLISVRIEYTTEKINKLFEVNSDILAVDGSKVIKYTNR